MATQSGILPGNPMDRGTWSVTVHKVTKESDVIWELNCNNNV